MKRRGKREEMGRPHWLAGPQFRTLPGAVALVAAGALLACTLLMNLCAAAQAADATPQDATRGGPEATPRAATRGPEVFAGNGCARAGSVTAGDCSRRGSDPDDGPVGDRDHPSTTYRHARANTPPEDDTNGPASPAEDFAEGLAEGGEDCAADGPKGDTTRATVVGTTDGDTIEISEPVRGTTSVRLIGVDTPETVDPDRPIEPYGEEASAFTEGALEGRRVGLEIGRDAKDDYGRLLAYLWTDDGMFDEELLARGYGRLMIIEPNDAYEECLAAAEHAAKNDEVGLWAEDAGDPPDSGDVPTEHATLPETTGASAAPTASASPTPDATTAPGAGKDSGDDGGGFFGPLLGGNSREHPAAEVDEATTADDGAPETTAPHVASPAGQQYGQPGAGEQWETKPEVQDSEIQDSEIQEPEIQEPEVQDPEAQEPEMQDGTSPTPDTTLGTTPGTLRGASPPASPSAAPSASPSVSPTASPEPKITLPETGGPPLLLLAASLLLGLLPTGLVARAGYRRATETRRRRETGDF